MLRRRSPAPNNAGSPTHRRWLSVVVERHIHSDISARLLYRSFVRGEPAVGVPDRQRATLTKIADAVARTTWLDALLVVGSLADGVADALSDIDLLVIVGEGQFEQAWADREALRVT